MDISQHDLKMHKARWNFLAGEITGLYLQLLQPGPNGNGLCQQLLEAVSRNDLDEMNHLTAVMLVVMQGRDQICAGAQHSWSDLNRTYHDKFCQHPICVERRQKENGT